MSKSSFLVGQIVDKAKMTKKIEITIFVLTPESRKSRTTIFSDNTGHNI